MRFPNSDGLCIGPEANIGTVNNLVIEGGGEATGADYGFVVGYRAGQQPVGATSNIRTSGASARIDANFGVNNFDRSGIWVGYGSSLYGEGRFTACGNGEAGMEADSGGFVTTGWYSQQPVFNGNGGNGLLAYNCSGIWAGGFVVACGNGNHGIASLVGSAIVLGSIGCHAAMNVGSGVAAEDGSAIDGQKFQAKSNSSSGLRSVRGASFVGTDSVSTGNGLYGAYSAGGANMTVTGATLTGNASHGAYTLNGFLDASNATSTGNGGYSYLSSGGNMRVPGAFGSTSTSGDFAAVNGGVMDATSTKGADASTGARYFADTRGFINAIGSVQTAATYNPPYNTVSNRNSLILSKDIQQKSGISRYAQSFNDGTTSYTPNIDNGQHHNVTFSGSASFAIANPTNAPNIAHEMVIQLKNSNGATAVTPSFGSAFVTGTVAAISAGGNSSVYTFRTYDGAKYVLTGKIENVVI
ncbi:uncharacterized PPE family protein PPE12-like [Procambarus clarkii]|uniref:uncharacterized PPE family protein PPE12-like n=1 Tax=Procambarus clarkii TaxID=6728 RepID=UPI003742B0F0